MYYYYFNSNALNEIQMFKPTTFYPAIIRNDGAPCLFTNECGTAHEAKANTQALIDNGSAGVGTKGHAIAGFAYFNEKADITYVFTTKEEMIKTLNNIKASAKSGATSKYAKLKGLKDSAIHALIFLNHKEEAKKIEATRTFIQFIGALNSVLVNERY